MKTPAKKQKRRLYWPLVSIVALLLIGGSAYAYYHHTHMQTTAAKNYTSSVRGVNTPSYKPSTSQDNTANNDRKSSPNPATTLDNGSTSTTTSTLSATIVSANVSSGNVHIGTLVNGATSGTCTITVTQGQTTVTVNTSSVQSDVNNYDCGAINVSTSQFPASGTWQLKLSVTSGSQQASSNVYSITI